MTFRRLNNQAIESSDGYSLQCAGRFKYVYKEGARSMSLYGEHIRDQNGKYGFAFEPAWMRLHWDAPHDQEVIASDQRKAIKMNIIAAMGELGGFAELNDDYLK